MTSNNNKCSAVAEMGDHLATTNTGQKEGAAVLLSGVGGELGPHLIQCGLGRDLSLYQQNVAWAEAYLRTKWHLHPSSRLATKDMGQKLGELRPFWGAGAGYQSNTMWPGLRLPPCQVSSCSIQWFGHNTPTSQTERQTGQTTVR